MSIEQQLKFLPRYSAILRKERSPGYRTLRTIPIDVQDRTIPWGADPWKPAHEEMEDSQDSEFRKVTEDLWDLHAQAMKQYNGAPKGQEQGKPGIQIGETRPDLLDLKIELARRMLLECKLCEKNCGVERSSGKPGACGVLAPRISSEFLHMGEEPCLVPSHTIFFAGCNLNCIFCQNWDISQHAFQGARFTTEDIARSIDQRSALNTNWVGGDPTPNLHFILSTLARLSIDRAQLWNSNMYLTTHSMELLDGAMDLYLTDFKFGNDECGHELSGVDRYFEVMKRNHGLLKGRDTIIRHLVLPGHLDCCTRPILSWIAENRPDAVVNVMAQYHPDHKAVRYPGLERRLTDREYREALRYARDLDLILTR